MIWQILGVLGWVFAIIAMFVAYRFYRRAVILDEVFQYLSDDIITNLIQFGKMSVTTVLSSDDEIQKAHQNMMTMGKRLDEILSRMEEATGLHLRPPPRPERPRVA